MTGYDALVQLMDAIIQRQWEKQGRLNGSDDNRPSADTEGHQENSVSSAYHAHR